MQKKKLRKKLRRNRWQLGSLTMTKKIFCSFLLSLFITSPTLSMIRKREHLSQKSKQKTVALVPFETWKNTYHHEHNQFMEYQERVFCETRKRRTQDIEKLRKQLAKYMRTKNANPSSLIKKLKCELTLLGIDDCILFFLQNCCILCICGPLTIPLFAICYCCIPTKTQNMLQKKCAPVTIPCIADCWSETLDWLYDKPDCLCIWPIDTLPGALLCAFACCLACVTGHCCEATPDFCEKFFCIDTQRRPKNESCSMYMCDTILGICCSEKFRFDVQDTCPWFASERVKTTYENIATCCPLITWINAIHIIKTNQYYFCYTKKIIPGIIKAIKKSIPCLLIDTPNFVVSCCTKSLVEGKRLAASCSKELCSAAKKLCSEISCIFELCGLWAAACAMECHKDVTDCCNDYNETPIAQLCCSKRRSRGGEESEEIDGSWEV